MSARRQREVLSPLVSTPNVQRKPNANSHFISPSTSRHTGICSPAISLMADQDDEKEKQARRRSRIMDLQRKNAGSPSSPGDRRRSLPLSGLSTAQLTEHYTSCIKLSAENKINAKNAFGLHLIDYMSDLLKKKELGNFQVASTTLDASAKIYAGRVDAIHTETYKVLSGLGRGDKNKQGEEEEGGDGAEGDDAAPGDGQEVQKKKKRVRKSKTVETNLKNINVNKFDLEFEVDPLFHMMSAAFDEGGTSGLLISNLRCFDNYQQLVLDSNTIIAPTNDLDTSRLAEREKSIDLSEIITAVNNVKCTQLHVCPSFSHFRFTNWDSSDQTSLSVPSMTEQRFDMDAEPEPIPIHDMDDDMSVFGGGDNSFGDDGDVEDVADTNLDDVGAHCIGDGKAAKLVQSVLTDMTHGTTGSLLQVLATEPSDYSYFNKALLRTWAGPAHWKAGHSATTDSWKSTLASKSQVKNKVKKPLFRLDFDEEVDFNSHWKSSKATALTKATLVKYSKDQTTLPKDHHYDADKLFRIFLSKKIMIKRQKGSADGVDDVIENYDYENINDKENYCPNDNNDDDDDSGGLDFNFGTDGVDLSQELSSQDPFSQSQETFTQAADGTFLSGDKLLAQPYKVAQIDIDYAKTAKRMDVRRLKSSIWTLLKETKDPDMEKSKRMEDGSGDNQPEASTSSMSPQKDPNKEMQGCMTFQELLQQLPEKVSGQTAKNLSVPIAFVCLLHLANEKTLKIEDIDMEDLKITQGL